MATTSDVPVKAGNGQLRRQSPFELFETFQEGMARLWNQTWPFIAWRWPRMMPVPQLELGAAWSPQVDIFEKNGDLVVKAELPGVKKEDVEVTVDRDALIIRGERKEESEVKEQDYYWMERRYGSFYRRLPMPAEIDAEKVKATFADGVLEVRVPKPGEAKPTAKKVTIA